MYVMLLGLPLVRLIVPHSITESVLFDFEENVANDGSCCEWMMMMMMTMMMMKDEDDDNNYDDDDRLNRRGTGNKEKRKSNGLVHSYSFDSKLKSG